MIKFKRIYEDFSKTDGYRVLIDRLWPRGISKDRAKVDLWIKEVAPSNDLRKWFHDNSGKTKEFQKRYITELKEKAESLQEIKKILENQKSITLLSASKDPKPIHGIVLRIILED